MNNIKQQATELVTKYLVSFPKYVTDYKDAALEQAKQCAIICCQYIINSNPHSNPFNTDIHSTMDYWQQVKEYIENNL